MGVSIWQLIIVLPLISGLAIPSYLLAKRKGYNRLLWTVIGAIPLVNYLAIWYFRGRSSEERLTFSLYPLTEPPPGQRRQPLLRGAVHDPEVPPRLPRALRRTSHRRNRLLPVVLTVSGRASWRGARTPSHA